VDLQQLIAMMAAANRTWGEERIAAELLVKLGIRVSPRTVRRYMPFATTARQTGNTGVEHLRAEPRRSSARQRFLCRRYGDHPRALRVCRSGVVYTTNPHWNVTEHPTGGDWTGQQFRLIVPGDQAHRFVIPRLETRSTRTGSIAHSRRWGLRCSRRRLAFHKRTHFVSA